MPCPSIRATFRSMRISRGLTPSSRTWATPGMRSSGRTIRRSSRSQLSLRSSLDDRRPSIIGMSLSRAFQWLLTVMSPMSSGRSRRIRSIFSQTSTRAICMSMSQSKLRPTLPPSSLHIDHILLRPLTEPRASSTGRTIMRSICSGAALGYGTCTKSCGSTTSGKNASGNRINATPPRTTRLKRIINVVTCLLIASSGSVMRGLLLPFPQSQL